MNGFLIGTLDVLNQLLAIFFIVAGTVSGVERPWTAGYLHNATAASVAGGILGFIAGLVAAGFVCGLIAAIIRISRDLDRIRGSAVAWPPAAGRYPPA